jgi:ribosome biogenesis GTPase
VENPRTEGLVVRVTGKEIWVDTGTERIACLLRGRFRRDGAEAQVVAGDRVEISAGGPGRGTTIESVRPRRSWLTRYTGGRDAATRVIVANLDVLFLVESLRAPALSYRFADRVLVSARNGSVGVRICLNKTDLAPDSAEADAFAAVYEPLGYPVTQTSAKTGEGIPEVAALLAGGIYAFVGRSGVGKSSLLNRIAPGLDLEVRDVAAKTGRGRHTTTYSQLFTIADGYVADTPGMQTFGFPGDEEGDLAGCFPEFRGHERGCRFQPCTHSHEPDCAVKEAVEEGRIATSRHESYLDMLGEIRDRKKKRYS